MITCPFGFPRGSAAAGPPPVRPADVSCPNNSVYYSVARSRSPDGQDLGLKNIWHKQYSARTLFVEAGTYMF